MPIPTDLLGIGLMMLSIAGPITAAIIKSNWGRSKDAKGPPPAAANGNGSKVDVREFVEFREEVRRTFQTISGQFETLRVLAEAIVAKL